MRRRDLLTQVLLVNLLLVVAAVVTAAIAANPDTDHEPPLYDCWRLFMGKAVVSRRCRKSATTGRVQRRNH
jgi:hypothetical protein